MISKLKEKKGMVLVLAILIIAAILGAAALFSNVVIREIQQSRLIDQSMQAYYFAESGAERALYQVRRREAVIDCDSITSGSVCETNGHCSSDDVFCINQDEGGLEVSGSWQVAADNEQETSVNLKKGESFQIDLFSPYQEADTAESSIDAIEVSRDDSLLLYGEFTNLTNILGITSKFDCASQPPVFKDYLISDEFIIRNLDDQDIIESCSYAFRLTFLPGPGESNELFTIKVYDRYIEQLKIPSRLIVDSSAEFGQSWQQIRVKTPIRPPLAGLYDFVLFSEQEIRKVQYLLDNN